MMEDNDTICRFCYNFKSWHTGPCVAELSYMGYQAAIRDNEKMKDEKLARKFHEIYERLAPNFGYETRKDTKEFDPQSNNGKLMIAVCGEIRRGNEI